MFGLLDVKLNRNRHMSTKKKLSIYDKPKYVYIPLISGNDTNLTLLVKKGSYVYKGSVLARRKGKFRIPIHSSVSGKVVRIEDKYCYNGKKVNTVVIENDFQEKYKDSKGVKRNLSRYTKQEFIEILKDCGVVGLGGAGFPTYVKYNSPRKIETLIVNAVESEPYITSDYTTFMTKCEEILEAVDAIMDINKIPEAIIAVSRENIKLINHIKDFIGTYLNIKLVLVPESYKMGYEKELIKYIKKINYQAKPINVGIVVNNVSTVYAIYEALKYQRPMTERIVTFTGDGLKKPQNIRVKVGTLASEVIESIGGYKKSGKLHFVAGGSMMGQSLPTDSIPISPNLPGVLILKEDTKREVETICIRCGKCVDYCPSKIAPILIKENINKPKMLKELQPERCIECGICSYICPARIELLKIVKQAKEKRL